MWHIVSIQFRLAMMMINLFQSTDYVNSVYIRANATPFESDHQDSCNS